MKRSSCKIFIGIGVAWVIVWALIIFSMGYLAFATQHFSGINNPIYQQNQKEIAGYIGVGAFGSWLFITIPGWILLAIGLAKWNSEKEKKKQ